MYTGVVARAASVGPLVLVTVQLAACRGVLGLEEEMPPLADAAEPLMCRQTGQQCISEDVLRICVAVGQPPVDELCAWGCTEVGAPHCAQLLPSGGAVQSPDLRSVEALGATLVAGPVMVNTDDGSITSLRTSGPGIENGIGYEQRMGRFGDTVALFTFGRLVVDGPILVRGSPPVAFVAHGDIAVNEMIDVRGGCAGTAPGPGGWPGGAKEEPAPGDGGGQAGMVGGVQTSGGGGGGHGAAGGTGGSNGAGAIGGVAGALGGDAVISRLRGGWGGGGGGGTDPLGEGSGGPGGGGGGAIQLASDGAITFGGVNGGINAGGCGGNPGTGQIAGGGGGGAGGAILVEAPVVRIAASARLAVNGGGGGGGRGGTAGEPGRADPAPARGGDGSAYGGAGGAGGASGAREGQDGVIAPHGGGGGGGTGRIRFHTRRGAIDVDASARLSPSLAEPDTTATQGVAATQ
jgi:hypothetical protein